MPFHATAISNSFELPFSRETERLGSHEQLLLRYHSDHSDVGEGLVATTLPMASGWLQGPAFIPVRSKVLAEPIVAYHPFESYYISIL